MSAATLGRLQHIKVKQYLINNNAVQCAHIHNFLLHSVPQITQKFGCIPKFSCNCIQDITKDFLERRALQKVYLCWYYRIAQIINFRISANNWTYYTRHSMPPIFVGQEVKVVLVYSMQKLSTHKDNAL